MVKRLMIGVGWMTAVIAALCIATTLSMSVFADSPACPAGGDATTTPPDCTTSGGATGGGTTTADPGTGGGGATVDPSTGGGGAGGSTPDPTPPPTTPDPTPPSGDTGSTTGGDTTSGDTGSTTGGDTTGGTGSTGGGIKPATDGDTGSTSGTHTGTSTTTHHASTAHQHHEGSAHKPNAAAAALARQRARAASAAAGGTPAFADARTFRDHYHPANAIPETPTLAHDAIVDITKAADRAGISWQLLSAIAWHDSRWGDPAAGMFIGTALTDAQWSTFGRDGDANGSIDRGSRADQLATVAALLASAKSRPAARLRAYFGQNERAVGDARLLASYHQALGLEGIELGLNDPTIPATIGARVIADKRVHMYPGGASDIAAGIIDPRVLVVIEFLADRYHTVTVSCLVSGHSVFTASGNVSLHAYGQAVDIAALNEVPIYGHQQGRGNITVRALKDILRLPASMQPKELISLWTLGGPSFALADHDDHIHIGYPSVLATAPTAPAAAIPGGAAARDGAEH